MTGGLSQYRRKRDFAKTPEPEGARRKRGAHAFRFVVQKHAARRLHYDFRLEMGGVLKSWAVPKGPSLDPRVKRLAVEVEDHPIEYGHFEGVIPEGEYGGGTVLVWDTGTWVPEGSDPETDHRRGSLKFELRGKRLRGRWALVRMQRRGGRDKNWLLIKEHDEFARPGSDDEVTAENQTSVLSGRDLDAVAEARDRVWHSHRTGHTVADTSAAATIDLGAVEGALAARGLLAELGPQSLVKGTGGKELHIVVPLQPRYGWDEITAFAKEVADEMVRRDPAGYTATLAKKARHDRIFVDYLRNQRGATAIAAYSVRARREAPVAAPLTWEEVEGGIRSDAFTMATLPRRIATLTKDPWEGLAHVKQSLPASLRRRLRAA